MLRALLLVLVLLGQTRAADSIPIRVLAGEYNRHATPVSFLLPAAWPHSVWLLRGETRVPVQVRPDGQACFVVDELAKGKVARYELKPAATPSDPAPDGLRARREGAKIHVEWQPRAGARRAVVALLDFQAEPGALPRPEIAALFRRGVYLHPIRTLAGHLVTDDFPPNHIHHHGVWSAWTKTVFDGREPDFWNMGEGKGRVDFLSVDTPWSGAWQAGFHSRQAFVDLTAKEPVRALDETWAVTVHAPSGPDTRSWMFDLVSDQECASQQALRLPEYRYGGVGVRGNRAWNGADKTFFLTSDGETDREKAHAARGRWCDMSGDVDGARAGIAILCHPDNFRAPQPMRVHPTEPFFNFAPQQAGEMAIEPGRVYRSKYRFVVHDGPPDRGELDRLWEDFAHPPVVEVARP